VIKSSIEYREKNAPDGGTEEVERKKRYVTRGAYEKPFPAGRSECAFREKGATRSPRWRRKRGGRKGSRPKTTFLDKKPLDHLRKEGKERKHNKLLTASLEKKKVKITFCLQNQRTSDKRTNK